MLDGLDGVMNLAAASGEDLATTSDIVTDALTAFGLEAEDSSHFADVLAAASSNANTNVSMMGETSSTLLPLRVLWVIQLKIRQPLSVFLQTTALNPVKPELCSESR